MLRVKDARQVPFVLCGTKCDLDEEREVTIDQGRELAKSLGKDTAFFETSAKTGKNVRESFYGIARMIKRDRLPKEDASTSNTSTPPKGEKKKGKKKTSCIIL